MLFGIGLKHFSKLEEKGEDIRVNFWTAWLLKRKSNKKYKVNSIQDLVFSDFVDMERCIKGGDYYGFCNVFVNKRFWQTIYIHNMPNIMVEYADQKKYLQEQNQYIYNPPQYGEQNKVTPGNDLRKEFVEDYGDYVVLMDVVIKWANTDYKSIEQWKTSEFFFWANYLTGQRILENIK